MINDGRRNLILTRRYGESLDIMVGEEKITVTFLQRKHGGPNGRQARFSIQASEKVKILRSECGPYKEEA